MATFLESRWIPAHADRVSPRALQIHRMVRMIRSYPQQHCSKCLLSVTLLYTSRLKQTNIYRLTPEAPHAQNVGRTRPTDDKCLAIGQNMSTCSTSCPREVLWQLHDRIPCRVPVRHQPYSISILNLPFLLPPSASPCDNSILCREDHPL